MKDVFKKIIVEFHEEWIPEVVNRKITLPDSDEIVAVIGLRRSGKTYSLFQKIKTLTEKGIQKNRIIFLNFEDERLVDLKAQELDLIFEAYFELYPNNTNEVLYLFFDEVQVVPSWNLFLKRLYERKKYKIFVSGSSSKLLSKEIATELRGRTKPVFIHLLDFEEYLLFKGIVVDKNFSFSKKRFEIKKEFDDFLKFGGYPLVAKTESVFERESTIKTYLELMIYQDIVERYSVRNTGLLKTLMKYIATNSSKLLSLNKFYIAKQAEGTVSKDAVSEYFSYLEEVGFVYVLPKFSSSLKKQILHAKKIYLADNGFKTAYGFTFSEDRGFFLENAVFLSLIRKENSLFYHNDLKECDFLILNKDKIIQAIQVSYSISDSETKKREIEGLLEALTEHGLNEGTIITYDEEEILKIGKKTIHIVPCWKWMLLSD